MEIKQAIVENAKILKENNIHDSYNIARILMAHTINKSKEYLVINDKEILKEEILQLYNTKIEKVKNGYPLQYITNNQEFMKLNFYVNDNVLIPQPDTEILVEEVIKMCKTKYKEEPIKVLAHIIRNMDALIVREDHTLLFFYTGMAVHFQERV